MNNQNITKLIDKITEVRINLTSNNGFPIFDLMIERSQPGFITASNVVFYTENKALIDKFTEAEKKGIEEIKKFFKDNPNEMSFLSDLRKNNIKEMTHEEDLAFRHLFTKKSFTHTLKAKYYGVSHLIENNEVLIFANYHSNDRELATEIGYANFQNHLMTLYNEGKIKPEAIIKDNAAKQIIDVIREKTNSFEFNDYQKENYLLLVDFSTVIGTTVKLGKTENNQPIIEMKAGLETIEISLPKQKNEDFTVKYRDKETVTKNLSNTLYTINSHISDTKVEKFIERNAKLKKGI